MAQNNFRTYRRRAITRESGYHTCEDTTGGECIILRSERIIQKDKHIKLSFTRKNLELIELFEQSVGIIAFGGYIKSSNKVKIIYRLKFTFDGHEYEVEKDSIRELDVNIWSNIGFHKEISLDTCAKLDSATIIMDIDGQVGNIIDFISFDFDIVKNENFINGTLSKHFYQKTSMHIPYLYYLNSQLSINKYLDKDIGLLPGIYVVLKSCNRCGRFLLIDICNELSTLSFSLHCKKKGPCTHSSFRAYTILNYGELKKDELKAFNLESDGDKVKVVSYYGHQLECKACKKFFVNAPLNPQRNPQQFKEDGLRRRAIEILVNELQDRNFVHFEFEKKTKKEFAKYIWNKFGQRCFKCQKKLPFEEMHLDHTMPLAYLYRLDEAATCLCSHHNSQKRDHFPASFYTKDELAQLSKITGLSLEQLQYCGVNVEVLSLLVKNVIWYFDAFLMRDDYQKRRDGILTADKINDSLKRVISGRVDLADEYKKARGKYPSSVTKNW